MKTKRTEAARAGTGDDMQMLRQIPSVERFLASEGLQPLIGLHGRAAVKEVLVEYLAELRRSAPLQFSFEGAVDQVGQRLEELARPSLRRVINATGVIIHTNLGRSPVDADLWGGSAELVSHYSNLEFDLETGERGSRDGHISSVATRLFGCEAAILTNNNAAGVMLLLAAIGAGKEIVVSRGELVEIGGSFRVPDVIQQGGALLREVGTTNRTRANDYTAAVGERTAAFLRVHRSNFEIVGFTETPTIPEMVVAAKDAKLPLLYDEGSGRVVDLSVYGFSRAETIRDLFGAGVDVVTCSTDKLIGATQGGLILGKKSIVDRCRKHPLMRALRAGKESYAVVTGVLRAFLAGQHEQRIPVYRMLAATIDSLRARGEAIASRTGARLVITESALGGGTTPTETIPSVGIEVPGNANVNAAALLKLAVPIVGRIREDRLVLDLRTIAPDEDGLVERAISDLR